MISLGFSNIVVIIEEGGEGEIGGGGAEAAIVVCSFSIISLILSTISLLSASAIGYSRLVALSKNLLYLLLLLPKQWFTSYFFPSSLSFIYFYSYIIKVLV